MMVSEVFKFRKSAYSVRQKSIHLPLAQIFLSVDGQVA